MTSTGTDTSADGLLIPRVDRQRAQSMTGVATSTLIYVNNIATGTATGTAVNIDATGYYYFDGTAWVKLNTPTVNLYNSNGTLTGNRTVTQGANTLAFTGNAVNAFSVDENTFSVDAANNRVGILNTAPTADLHVGNGTNGPAIPTIRLTSSLNEFAGGGVLQFLENNQGYGTIVRHHSGNNADGTQKEGLYFNNIANNVESTKPTLMLEQTGQRVGINTGDPKTTLDVAGNMTLGSAAESGTSDVSTLVRDNATGEIKVLGTSSGNTASISLVTYNLNNVNLDWVSNYDTKINTADYNVVIVGSAYSNSNQSGLIASTGADFNSFNAYAFASGGTWRLAADYNGASSQGGVNGNWSIVCMVINKNISKILTPVTQNLGGSSTGAAAAPPSGL